MKLIPIALTALVGAGGIFGIYQGGLVQGVYSSGGVTLVNGQTAPLQLNASGQLITSGSGGGGGGGGVIPAGSTYENANSNGTPITTATTVQIFAAVASNKHHAWIQFSNSSTTGTVVQILDGSTIISETYCAPSGGGLSDAIPVALYGSTNTSLSIKVLTAGASIYWTVRGFYATT